MPPKAKKENVKKFKAPRKLIKIAEYSEKKKAKSKAKEKPIINDNEDIFDTTIEYQNDYREIMATYDIRTNKSNPNLSIYEAALIIGKRATQISYGAEPTVPYELTDTPEKIAIRELLEKRTPFIVKRRIGDKTEYWFIKDMILNEEEISIYE